MPCDLLCVIVLCVLLSSCDLCVYYGVFGLLFGFLIVVLLFCCGG